jgi:hypothetical protein
MKKRTLYLVLFALVMSNIAMGQENMPINDLPGAKLAPGLTETSPPASRDYTGTNCLDLTQFIEINLGLASPSPGSIERVGIQEGRITRNGVASTCPSMAFPGITNPGTSYGYHAIQFSNWSSNPVCITVNVLVDGTSTCGTNAHASVYQSVDGLNPAPYDPLNLATNYLGDLGSSVSQPFSVTVNPGYFEIVFNNNSSVSQCEVAFNITVDPADAGSIHCDAEPATPVPVSNWPIIFVVGAIVLFTLIRFRKKVIIS